MKRKSFSLIQYAPLFLLVICTCVGSTAHASPPLEGAFYRIGLETTAFQEPLNVQDPVGDFDQSVANYKGFTLSFEKQWRTLGGGYGLLGSAGAGQVSAGGTSKAVAFTQGAASWTVFAVEPSMIWTFNERIDFAVCAAGTYRGVTWAAVPTGYQLSPAGSFNAVFYLQLDISLSEHFGMRQAIGVAAASSDTYWRWGLTYDP